MMLHGKCMESWAVEVHLLVVWDSMVWFLIMLVAWVLSIVLLLVCCMILAGGFLVVAVAVLASGQALI